MFNENALVVYKNRPALIKEKTTDKILIALSDGASVKVREKDIELIHPGPVKNFNGIVDGGAVQGTVVRESWELLLAEQGEPVSLKELAELVYGEYVPASAWAAFSLLLDGLYFTGSSGAIRPRPQEQVEADEKKRSEKQQASGERELFLERLRRRDLSSDDRRFMQDVEALAYGKSNKSRTMKDIGLGETPEEAHALLLESGFWTEQINPHPVRCGVSLLPARQIPDPPPVAPPAEERRDLCRLAAFAIDSPWSHDPDDAVSFERENGRQVLYVHVADPAAVIGADSPAEKEARDRGSTLYIPEGNFRMLADETLPVFALGLAEKSVALTFKITLNDAGDIAETAIFPSIVKVLRLTYEEADKYIPDTYDDTYNDTYNNTYNDTYSVLRDLHALAERNLKRRAAAGAINITMPEIHMSLDQGRISIEPIVQYRSANMVRECMLLAGEGAGIWAMQHNVPFPYIEQEADEAPDEILPGMAGSYQLRRCMRPRLISVKPGRHGGLGLNAYTQVTSPLRRYTDLLAHIQIRAFLRGGKPFLLSTDEIAARLVAGEAASLAVSHAERASRNHWMMVYLAGKKDSVWDAVALEKKGNRWAAIIPALALETQVPLRKEIAPNDPLKLILKSASIPRGEAIFVAEE
ncbi:MAG: RNB domain-containing ribonuclease [Treponema sp.]|jgi:exoribonuclease-2|nr:RNB domain-containing ribonuclease [Treponema sp.]